MPNVAFERSIGEVRSYLRTLNDGPAASKRGGIGWVADEFHIQADDLRRFRDKNDDALARPIVAMFAQMLGRGQDIAGIDVDNMGFADPSTGGWYGALMAEETIRQGRLRQYQLIDRTRSEAHAALDAWADMGCTGNVTEDARYGGGFEPVVYGGGDKAKKLMNSISQRINNWLIPDSTKVQIFRSMVKYGDQFGALGIGQVDGTACITKVAPRRASTIWAVRDDGVFDPARAWKQVIQGRTEPVATFAEWEMVHFANTVEWGDIYGQSVFEPLLRSYIQVESMESAMLIRRLERAAMRYKWTVDVGSINGPDEKLEYLRKVRVLQKKKKSVDNSGNFQMQKISAPPDEDLFVPKSDKDSPSDVEVLDGDKSIGEVADVQMFMAKWFSGLGPPKAHLGYDDDSSKTGVNDKTIVFARKVRRMQLKFITGLNHMYWVSMILQGVDPRSIRWAIFPPALSTKDEQLRATVLQAYANAAYYITRATGMSGQMPSCQWILKYILHLDQEVIDELELVPVIQQNGAGDMKNDPAQNPKEGRELQNQVLANPEMQRERDHLDFHLAERQMAKRSDEIGQSLMRHQPPPLSETGFSQCVKELRNGQISS